MSTKINCCQYSKRLNGGNQALHAFYVALLTNIDDASGNTIYLRGGVLNALWQMLLKRKEMFVVSDPFTAILLGCFRCPDVIHFVQSDDLNLFHQRGKLFNTIYRGSYRLFVGRRKWLRVFNSEFSRQRFNSDFSHFCGAWSVMPMLGIDELFPATQLVKKSFTRNRQYIWIGSAHSFKGGISFVKAMEATNCKGTMIFNGQIPEWAVSQHVDIISNVDKERIYTELMNTETLIFTSQFDSFALPIFEALMAGCSVVATDAGFLRENGTDKYIEIVKGEEDLISRIKYAAEVEADNTEKIDWLAERESFKSWVSELSRHFI
ncbi:glycosyltransferase [Neptuniibacter caesariensis]|uniref:Glycosyl transferase family 1 domain-containing protein n=1 Tax=Neptuniibacter caesariensis TaxID=207954 RepID=A0A7U8C2Y3_NEPCE|nr:glycosyltransferase [Neptuniibacter caesariensis]EAR60527.1 hypothetical protein MED92_16725 [Oceanospirillum sp. MED92] [Neptuniibacter caesariensis]